MARTRRQEALALAAANRRIEVFKLRQREGLTFPEIATKLGVTVHTVLEDYQRLLREGSGFIPPEEREAGKNAARLKLDEAERRCLEVLNRDHYVVSHGKLMVDESGNHLIDDGPIIQALNTWVKIMARRAALEGHDASTKFVDLTPELVDAEIERRCRMLGIDPEKAQEAARAHLSLVLGEAG